MNAGKFARVAIAASVLALSGSAFAADIGDARWQSAAPPESVYSWTGFYAGANVGIGITNMPTNYNIGPIPPFSVLAFPAFDAGAAGPLAGAQVGYNYQIGTWVFGAEADFQGSTVNSSNNCVFGCVLTQRLTHTTDLPWFGTVRGRIGTTMGGLLFYYTGGLAYGDVKTHVQENFPFSGTLDFTETRFGWTIGSGIEAALGGNWTGRAEYLFVDLGTTSNTFTLNGVTHSYSTDVQQHVFRLGLNYRFGPAGQVPPPLMQPKRWSGFYGGFNVSNAVGRNPSTVRGVFGVADTFDIQPTGWFGGVQAGYNWQLRDSIVLGVEADIQGGWQDSDKNCALTCSSGLSATIKQELPWWGTVRGRLGYTVGPALFYVAGGLAYGEVKNKITETVPGFATGTFNTSEVLVGWTFGGGVETPVGPILGLALPNWTIRTEYLFIDLGNTLTNYTYANTAHVMASDIRNHVFRTSVNYQFSGP